MSDTTTSLGDTSRTVDSLALKTRDLELTASSFSRAMTQAFAVSITGGKQFDDVLKSLTLRLSSMSINLALKPVQAGIAGGLNSLISGLTGTSGGGTPNFAAAAGAIKPFASGGVIGAPAYFPLMQGGVGLAGEAGPEAIMPLRRGPDGRLGVAGAGGGVSNVTIQIATPDPGSFRRSESYITGQIARAVVRGQRSM
ncbi:MAG: phage tail tape measure protein [Xanthobacteraceae bacterium]|nr:phage tail tape measure protein [Xanthobacteraceae bacterium]